MKKIDLGQTLNTLANVGVIAGIVFLGVELRQNTATIQGVTYQGLSEGASNQYLSVTGNPDLAAVLSRVYNGATLGELESLENGLMFNFYYAHLQRLENSYLQLRVGLVDEVVLESYGWNDRIFRTPHFSEFWQQFGGDAVSPQFREFFDDQMAEKGLLQN